MKEKQRTKASEKLKHNIQREIRRQKGITLIALIITIVILIILATITINIAFGDNGLIKRAQQSRDLYANESASELDVLNEVDEYLKEKIEKAKGRQESSVEKVEDDPVENITKDYTNIYATLYDDGTLGFSNNEEKIVGLEPVEGKTWDITETSFSVEWHSENIEENGEESYNNYYIATTPWFEDRDKIKKVIFVNEIVPKSVTGFFMGCTNLTQIENISNLKTDNVTSLAAMFSDCLSLESIDISGFNTSNVKNMKCIFDGYSNEMALTTITGLNDIDTSKVENMSYMFESCTNLNSLDINFNTENVRTMYFMFDYCTGLESISFGENFNTSNVEDMGYMFCDCMSLESIDVSSFDTSNVKYMDYMFAGYYTDMGLNGIVGINGQNFDTSNVESMEGMFFYCVDIRDISVSNFKTGKVTNMSYMFSGCMSLESIDLSNFDTSNVTNMSDMFWQSTSLKSINLTGFDTSKVTDMWGMFGCYDAEMMLTEIKGLDQFNTNNVEYMGVMFQNCGKMTEIDVSSFNTSNVTDMSYMFWDCYGIKSLDLSGFDTRNVTNMNSMIGGCRSLTELTLGENFKTDKVTDMAEMFNNDVKLTKLDLSNFNTENVTDMSMMFQNCSALEEILVGPGWIDEQANKTDMFKGCKISAVTPATV